MSETALRAAPWSEAAEQSVLGALLQDNSAFDRVADVLTEGEFYSQRHRMIFAAICGLIVRSRPADIVTVFEQLHAAGDAEEVGGLEYLNALAESVVSAAGARRYAEIVAEKALRRRVIAACDEAATLAFGSDDTATVMDRIATTFGQLERRTLRRAPVALRDLVVGRLDRITDLAEGKAEPGITTGIPRLDRMLAGGLRDGGLYILAARPSIGKSSFAQSIGLHVAEIAGPVLMLSQEMPTAEVVDRALSHLGRVNFEAIQTGQLADSEWSALTDGTEQAAALPFYVDDQPSLRLGEMRGKARQVKGLRLLIVDYLQLSAGDGDNRNAEIEQISRGLKSLAKDLKCPVLVLSQLNREVEKRASKEPMLSDLRDSGAIEQDADVVLFLWPVREFEGGSRLVGLKVEKNRQGKRGRFGLDFHGAHHRWAESTEPVDAQRRTGNERGFE